MKNEETLLHVANIEVVADNGGLSLDQFGLIVEQLSTLPCPALLARRLLNLLVPASSIPANILVDLALWALGNKKHGLDHIVLPVIRVISLCLQYNSVRDKQELVNIYELFLSLLSRDKLTTSVADLLQMLTGRSEVTAWRVREVVKVQARSGTSHQLDSLLWLYRQWRPDLVPSCKAPKAAVINNKTVLGKRFHKIWEANVDRSLEEEHTDQVWMGGFQIGNIFKKSQRTTLIPSNDVLPSTNIRRRQKEEKKKPLSEVTDFKQLLDNIHRLKLPANIISLLRSRVTVLVLCLDQRLIERFSINVYHLLRNEFLVTDFRKVSQAEKEKRHRRQDSILSLVVRLQNQVQQGLPVVGRFLTDYLQQWDGKTHFLHILRLISQLQITDYVELHDCIIGPIQDRHLKSYNTTEQLILFSNLHKLLRSWAAVEYKRFNNPRRSIFPVNTDNCVNALESIQQLVTAIGEMSTLALSGARERMEGTHLLTNQVLMEFTVSQKVMVEYEVPLMLQLPTHFLYDALFSHSADLIDQSCQYLLTIKREVLPLLKTALRNSELENGKDHPTSLLIEEMLTEESKEPLQAACRDFLVFLSSGQVNLTETSILRQGWELEEGEDWLKESLFISCHPAILPIAMEYLDSLNLSEAERKKAWEDLLNEQDEDSMEANISLDDGPRLGARSFYGRSSSAAAGPAAPSQEKLGKFSDFLEFVKRDLPSVQELIMEFKQKAAPPRPPTKRSQRELDLRSVTSHLTEDSGVESLKPKRSRRSKEDSGQRATKSKPALLPQKSSQSGPRSGGGLLADVSNTQY